MHTRLTIVKIMHTRQQGKKISLVPMATPPPPPDNFDDFNNRNCSLISELKALLPRIQSS